MEKIFTITLNHSFEDTIDNSLYTTLTEEDAMLLNYDHVQIKLRFTDMDVMYYKAKKEQNNLYKSLIIENDGNSVESEIAFFLSNTLVITTETLSTGGGGGESDIKTLDLSFTADNTIWTLDSTNNKINVMLTTAQATQLKDFLNTYAYQGGHIAFGLNFNNTPSVFVSEKMDFNCNFTSYNDWSFNMTNNGITLEVIQKHITFDFLSNMGYLGPIQNSCKNDIALNVLTDDASDVINIISFDTNIGSALSGIIQLLNTNDITIHLEGKEV